MTGALSHIRVLDLSRILAGPWASQILGDLGAEVIKVERPGVGDDTRSWGPPFLKDETGRDTDTAAYFLSANRNKRSITLDMAKPEGQALIRELAGRSDVLLENFKVGGLQQYGLDYAALKAINPRLVYSSITGFGQTGPYANRAGYDFLIQGLGGLMSLTGLPDGREGAGPMKVGVALTDVLTGLYATSAILAALVHREKTGEGQYIDVSLLDVQVACLANQALNYCTTGQSPKRLGNAHPSIVPYEDFPTADGYMILAIGNDAQFARFCAEAGQAELAEDPRFATNAERVRNRAALIPLLRRITVTRETSAWVRALEAKAIPCGPINDLAGVFADPQVKAREMQLSLPHPGLGPIPQVASPIRLSGSPVTYRRAPPQLGEHTSEVLRDVLGLSEQRIEQLRRQGIV
ncbi:L-carnitine dehydratase/bile acid-inducible protein F [Azotobacter vinelandii CA]|uniref:L-carnitine dehydratase/bile acid-inducible protein F n=2 Tax=Azotobacter vinelandii TaxID=354 RepID=C1DIJ5_AZOVD|nr:CaiB/BaiF CoA-transferase family protein [Azotobacter vinelandii]ACO78676.1 L-carnitine dehydratase/bile acid-inducible protein F [Azotobacter vinelandii DJ]AGK16664.1 L-carnitine dehydratase/bile acid-inducible protein F [Azotobacter vinelandii CA]AGK20649.1 L-carnitine dehydratase/bile acid-inducible protein F [Azotobacter vinelandii CA6]SFY05113.1 Crotonobetainyl-CoA:carnitine CoA-transferase CaiB [Azotobacter vinelandii]GLK62415.1 CoA transferase [Azotobacter vinelandii]